MAKVGAPLSLLSIFDRLNFPVPSVVHTVDSFQRHLGQHRATLNVVGERRGPFEDDNGWVLNNFSSASTFKSSTSWTPSLDLASLLLAPVRSPGQRLPLSGPPMSKSPILIVIVSTWHASSATFLTVWLLTEIMHPHLSITVLMPGALDSFPVARNGGSSR